MRVWLRIKLTYKAVINDENGHKKWCQLLWWLLTGWNTTKGGYNNHKTENKLLYPYPIHHTYEMHLKFKMAMPQTHLQTNFKYKCFQLEHFYCLHILNTSHANDFKSNKRFVYGLFVPDEMGMLRLWAITIEHTSNTIDLFIRKCCNPKIWNIILKEQSMSEMCCFNIAGIRRIEKIVDLCMKQLIDEASDIQYSYFTSIACVMSCHQKALR